MKNFIFDFDGTLADSSSGIYKAFCSSCLKTNLNPPNINYFKKFIGPPIDKLIYNIFPDIEDIQKNIFIESFRADYDKKFYKDINWYEDILETINFLIKERNGSIYIITNKPTLICIKLLKESKLIHLFEKVIGIDYRIFNNEHKGKVFDNKSTAIEYFFSNKNLIKDQSVYIGDTYNDKIAADKCKIKFIAAKYGFYDWDKDKNSSLLSINSLNELIGIYRI